LPIYQQGALNTTALIVPGLYVQIIPPNNYLLNGVPTNILAPVGTASWGPVNEPFTIGSMAEYAQYFGPVLNRQFDCGTAVALATLQGAQNFLVNRVTDGTDTASTYTLVATDPTMAITVGGTAHTGDVLTLAITPTFPTLAAASSFTTSSRTITMSGVAPTGVTPGIAVFDNTTGKQIGNVLTYTASTLTLLYAATSASSGSSDSLSFGGFGGTTTTITYQMTSADTLTTGAAALGTLVANNAYLYSEGISPDSTSVQAAASSWTTSVKVITMSGSAPSNVFTGIAVYDNTNSDAIGTVASWVGTTLTLVANAAFASSGSSDSLSFGGPAPSFKLHWGLAAPTVVASVSGAGATTTLTAATAGSTANVPQISFWSIYTGSYGNNETISITNGSSFGSWKVVVSMPGLVPETFDNISAGVSGNQVWSAIASAINNGVSGIRGSSLYLRANAGVGTNYQNGNVNGAVTVGSSLPSNVTNWSSSVSSPAPTKYFVNLAGGSDGYTGFLGTNPLTGYSNANTYLLGADVISLQPSGNYSRTGMYALRNQGVSIALLCDCPDMSTWSTQVSFGLFEGIYMIVAGPPSDTIVNASGPQGTLSTYGINSYAMKAMFGDWVYWFDPVNNLQRLVSPASISAGMLSNLSPQNSTLNKQVFGIIGTQKSATGINYTYADLQAIAGSGWDLIANPIPQGNVFGVAIGRNTSSNAVIHGDNYTRMTNYIAATLNRGMGIYVGQLQSRRPTDQTRSNVKATLDAFMQALLDQGMIDDFQNICDLTNNSVNMIALGYLQSTSQVVYLAVVEYFIASIQGGQSVTINKISASAGANVGGTFAAQPDVNAQLSGI